MAIKYVSLEHAELWLWHTDEEVRVTVWMWSHLIPDVSSRLLQCLPPWSLDPYLISMHRAHPFQRHGAGFWKDGSVLKGGDQPKYILYKGTIPALHTPEKWLPEGYCISWFPTEGQEKIGILTLSCPPPPVFTSMFSHVVVILQQTM